MVALEAAPAVRTQPPAMIDTARQAVTTSRAQALLDWLPATYRTVLTHRLLEGASLAETARRMSTSAGNVKVLQHRALTRARRLHEEGGGDG
jgi:RNA polymerase sigma-70 factor (ECF subfamily)